MKSKTALVFLYYFSFVNFIFGAKLWLIGKFGNATPFWDQWDTEGNEIYKPFIDGTLKFTAFLIPHNEHCLLTTRLLSLIELMVNGIWNPFFQMVVNAALHILVMVVVIALIARVIGRHYLPALLGFSALLFTLPLGWENTLMGCQEQMYFVLLFSIICLWLTTTHEPFSFWWNCGLFSSFLAFASFASGILCLAASIAVGIIFYLLKLRKTNQQVAAVIIMAGLFITGIKLIPVIAGHQDIKASSTLQFAKTLYCILSWPSSNMLLGIFLIGPVLIFCALMFWRRPPASNNRWFLISLIIYMLGVSTSIAYGRAANPLSSRYLDFFLITVLINFSCLLLFHSEQTGKRRKQTLFVIIIWVLYSGISLQVYNACLIKSTLRWYSGAKLDQEKNTKGYVETGDMSYLENKESIHIPYPNPKVLAAILDLPEIRNILPSDIAPSNRLVKDGRFDREVNFLIRNYYIFLAIGLLSTVICGLLSFFARNKKAGKIPL